MSLPVLARATNVAKEYVLPRTSLFSGAEPIQAVGDVSFELTRGESLGVVGESGCGKSTLARLVMALEAPTDGQIEILGQNPNRMTPTDLRNLRRHFQMVFQDPFSALDPRHKVSRIIAEPLEALLPDMTRLQRQEAALEVMQAVGLRPGDADKYPHEFSGGQRQRIAIARALVTRPELIVADEPVSALDVSVQAQVLNLMRDLQDSHGVTYILISHDLAVVEYVCDMVMVMYLGRVVEMSPSRELFQSPSHPYTRLLLSSVPRIAAGRRKSKDGKVSDVGPIDQPSNGCAFAPRCMLVEDICWREQPDLRAVGDRHHARCHLV